MACCFPGGSHDVLLLGQSLGRTQDIAARGRIPVNPRLCVREAVIIVDVILGWTFACYDLPRMDLESKRRRAESYRENAKPYRRG